MPRWMRWALGAVVTVVLAAVVLVEVAPWQTGPPQTGLRVLTNGPAGLTWVEVDTGARMSATDAVSNREREADTTGTATVVGSGVVVQRPSEDVGFADAVVGYIGDQQPYPIGEADLVAPASGTSVWLVVNGDPPTAGGVALASAYGTWRSKVFSVPPRLQVVGAAADGLVAVRGGFRTRRLILWDPQVQEQIREMGWVVGVREVSDRFALVTTGCLTSGCAAAMVDVTSGKSTNVEIPLGWREVGAPRLVPEIGGIAVVVADQDGRTALALGAPDGLEVVDGLSPAAGQQAIPGPGGWLLVPLADGDVAAWHEDLSATELPRVELSVGEQLIGVSQ